jgi:hypothetical protein
MSDGAEEFQKIRGGIEAATDILANCIERHGGGSWDYLIVAVPVNRGIKEVGMMSSVQPESLASFLDYLLRKYVECQQAGRVIDDRPPSMKPS